MRRTIVVTGGAGFIGSNIVAKLCEDESLDVVVCDWLGEAAQNKWKNLSKSAIADFVAPEDLFHWLAERGVGPVDFIKIDVEGFEPEVLAGAARTIVAQRPTLFMEFNSITTMFEARLNPVIFAEAIWSLFDVSLLDAEGSPQPAPTAREFVFRNITERGCVDDLVLRVKDGVTREQIIATMPATPPTQQA